MVGAEPVLRAGGRENIVIVKNITETIFSIPGMGRLLADSISFRDYPTIQGLLMIFALQYVLKSWGHRA